MAPSASASSGSAQASRDAAPTADEIRMSTCHPQACRIQSCLQKNTFQQDKCENLIDDLYRCCARFYRDGTTTQSKGIQPDACPVSKTVDRRIATKGLQI